VTKIKNVKNVFTCMIQFTLLTSGVAYPFWTVTAHENLYTTYNNSNNNNMQSYKGHKVKHA